MTFRSNEGEFFSKGIGFAALPWNSAILPVAKWPPFWLPRLKSVYFLVRAEEITENASWFPERGLRSAKSPLNNVHAKLDT